MENLWLVCEVVTGSWDEDNQMWSSSTELSSIRVVNSEEKAIASCKSEKHFMVPIIVNGSFPNGTTDMLEISFPLK